VRPLTAEKLLIPDFAKRFDEVLVNVFLSCIMMIGLRKRAHGWHTGQVIGCMSKASIRYGDCLMCPVGGTKYCKISENHIEEIVSE
jgi:hypothetical protein